MGLQLLLHAASFDPDAHLSVSHAFLVWLLSVGSFGFMFAVPDNPLLKKKEGDSRPRVSQGEMWAALPTWFTRTLMVLAAYLAVTFIWGVFALRNGGAYESQGRYWAENRKLGVAAHAITAAEYWSLESHEVRLLSGLGALFASLPVIALVWHGRRQRGAG